MSRNAPNTIQLHASRSHALRDVTLVAFFLLGIAAFVAHAMQS